MILTVTLNPAVDKLYVLDEFEPCEVNRVKEVQNTAGGKGINVSRVAALAGEETTAMGFIGGYNGELFDSLITEPHLTKAFTRVQAQTRSCVNVRDLKNETGTELLEPGKAISAQECAQFLVEYEEALAQATVVVVAGSVPEGVPVDFYATLVEKAKAANKPVILDSSGASLKAALGAKPTMIKPNADEIQQLCNVDIHSREELIAAAKSLQATGIPMVVVSLGGDGVLVVAQEGVYTGKVPPLEVVNTTGCGDSMVAGFAVGMTRGLPLAQTIAFASCVASANALTKIPGQFRNEDVEWLLKEVCVTRIADV